MKKNRRLRFVIFIVLALAAAVALALTALRDNVSFFYAPHEVRTLQAEASPRVATGQVFRMGGIVKEGSVRRSKTAPVIDFVISDLEQEVPVTYRGLLPDLFREGQGVVATGSIDEEGIFMAKELLAKHDENYMPPEVAKSLKKQGDALK